MVTMQHIHCPSPPDRHAVRPASRAVLRYRKKPKTTCKNNGMLDLFGEVIVTEDDVQAWVEAVAPAFASNQRSFALYVRCWSVVDKIRVAKRTGTFDTTIERARLRHAALAKRLGVHAAITIPKRPS